MIAAHPATSCRCAVRARRALEAVGIARDDAYVANGVKHFSSRNLASGGLVFSRPLRVVHADSELGDAGMQAFMHVHDGFAVQNLEAARSLARAHPFVTIVTADLYATHMPCLVDEDADELAFVGHVARADPVAESLDGPVLLIVHGPHGYISASWYASDRIPTWNHVTLHVRGTPELLDDATHVLTRTVEHLESVMQRPWSLDRMGEARREMADRVVAFRLRAQSWHAEAKLSQDKPAEERARVIAGLELPGPYAHPALAAAMRRTVA